MNRERVAVWAPLTDGERMKKAVADLHKVTDLGRWATAELIKETAHRWHVSELRLWEIINS